jgi:hypothetical protein
MAAAIGCICQPADDAGPSTPLVGGTMCGCMLEKASYVCQPLGGAMCMKPPLGGGRGTPPHIVGVSLEVGLQTASNFAPRAAS